MEFSELQGNGLQSIEASGKSVDEAIFKGLQQMGISIDEVSIEIIQTETKGILGIGAKPAKVRLTQRPPEEYEIPDYMKKPEDRYDRNRSRFDRKDRDNKRRQKEEKRFEKPVRKFDRDEKSAVAAEQKKDSVKAFEQVKPITDDRPVENLMNEAGSAPIEKPVREPKPHREKREERPVRAENVPAEAVPSAENTEKAIEYTIEAAKENPAAEFVQGLIDLMGAEGTVLAAKDEECIRLRIDSDMMGMLIGHRGETLDAMQYLTGLVINKNRKTDGYTRVTLNTEEYREKREETLKRLARKVAAQVRATGRPKALEPMNPYERRVLHSALQNNPDVTTHSEGEEPNRRVVVTPRRRNGYNRNRSNRRGRSNYKRNNGYEAGENTAPANNNVENYENSAENAEA